MRVACTPREVFANLTGPPSPHSAPRREKSLSFYLVSCSSLESDVSPAEREAGSDRSRKPHLSAEMKEVSGWPSRPFALWVARVPSPASSPLLWEKPWLGRPTPTGEPLFPRKTWLLRKPVRRQWPPEQPRPGRPCGPLGSKRITRGASASEDKPLPGHATLPKSESSSTYEGFVLVIEGSCILAGGFIIVNRWDPVPTFRKN